MKNFKIGTITNSTSGQSLHDLQKSAGKYGAFFELVPTPFINISHFFESEFVQKLRTYDAIYYRTGLRDTVLEALTDFLNENNKVVINGSSKANVHRKIQQALIAATHGIKQPKSLFMSKPNFDVIVKQIGCPFVAKPDFASHGNDVVLVYDADQLTDILSNTTRDRWLFQEYINQATEYRVYTLGDRYITSYKKIAGDNDFRANLHAGGTMVPTESKYIDMLTHFSERVARVFQSDIAGIDVFIKNDECYFIELNWQPGWEALDVITGTYFSDETIKYILHKAENFYSST